MNKTIKIMHKVGLYGVAICSVVAFLIMIISCILCIWGDSESELVKNLGKVLLTTVVVSLPFGLLFCSPALGLLEND